ncbi:hypothetical protein FNV43_RR07071 [Rhamnella rubrinervis]|uniref:Uncharacterized protein n=1 Tax=Rhamnella rubrinervis TaxID=2594499 RepID=A0A8K0MM14_9ROSA|nr:hypothetical protein FNV43_RR07071 [Rhamnella rubrinervis]
MGKVFKRSKTPYRPKLPKELPPMWIKLKASYKTMVTNDRGRVEFVQRTWSMMPKRHRCSAMESKMEPIGSPSTFKVVENGTKLTTRKTTKRMDQQGNTMLDLKTDGTTSIYDKERLAGGKIIRSCIDLEYSEAPSHRRIKCIIK